MMAESTETISLQELHKNIQLYFNENSSSEEKEFNPLKISSNDEIIEKILICIDLVDKHGIFSKNEEIDDFSTSSLQYLELRYYLGKAHSQVQEISKRYNHLRQAKISYEAYIQQCIRIQLVKGKDIGYDEDGEIEMEIESADVKRNKKIEQFKRNREAQQRIQALKRMISSASMTSKSDDILADHEEEIRELKILELQTYTREAVNELPIISQEMQLLRLREDIQEGGSEAFDDRIAIMKPGEGPGISVTRINKVGDNLITTREQIKASVFTPRMEGPSISLEEYGDYVKQQAIAASEAEAAAAGQDDGTRRYKNLEAAGDEDDDELVDKATIADRDWDAFKEANPRGWGNKMNKRY